MLIHKVPSPISVGNEQYQHRVSNLSGPYFSHQLDFIVYFSELFSPIVGFFTLYEDSKGK